MLPAYGDGITTTALAVSTSQSGVLTATVAPSSTRQATSWASVKPSPRSGRRKVWSAIRQSGVRGLQDAVDVGQVEFFVARRGIGNVQPTNAPNRRLKYVEGVVADPRGDLRAEAAKDGRLVHHHGAVGLAHRGHDCVHVQGRQAAKVDDFE